jgi:WD40 repeat protein
MQKLIRGEISEASMRELRRVMLKKKLMVFVSSTFLDTNLERDILHRKILPDLQKKAQQYEVQVIFYDMRFGVKDENTRDHMTWVACKEAIEQCHVGSDGLFFLSLQADRYGYRPLPKYLDQHILLKAVNDKDHTEENLNVLKEWYILDENNCPPRYELRPLKVAVDGKISDPEYWDKVLPLLRDSVFDSVVFETCASHKEDVLLVNRSVTEWETLFGLDCDKECCYWVHRSFDKDKLKAFKTDPHLEKITDGEIDEKSTALKLNNLKAKMKSTLRADQYSELLKQLSPADYFDENRCIEYLLQWERVTRDCLEKELEKVIAKSVEWKKGFANIPADYVEEIIHHCSTAFTKASSFVGREELVQRAMDILNNGRTTANGNTTFSSINLALVGRSGCGKTALMSTLGVSSLNPAIPTIIRFCGTSKFSLNGLKLIQSISIQILAVYERNDELEKLSGALPSQDYESATETFQKLMTQYPVNLFIDSLDQLENRNEERSKLTFLRGIKPHEQAKVVVSTLPDEYDEAGKPGKYSYHCEKTLKAGNVCLLDVGNVDSIETTFEELLTRRHRQLTNDQWIVTLKMVEYEPTILYISLAMEVVSQWRSFEKEFILQPTVKGIIHQIFDGVERNFGKDFTAIAFGMITFSREGVNDHEMQDLLSLHDGVMTEVCQYSSLHCFPMHAWLRLKYVVKNLVTEKENHCIRWYHRQLWETASERYSEKKKECHGLMGRYFTNSFDSDVMKEKDIVEQPLRLSDFSIWHPECLVNRRRVIEGYYHLINGGLLDEAIEEICSLEFVGASAMCGDSFNLLHCMSLCFSLYSGSEDKKRKLDHYFRWIRKRANAIASNPSWMVRSTAGEEPSESEVWHSNQVLSFLHAFDWNNCRIVTCARYKVFDDLEMDLRGHSKAVKSVSWSHDGSRVISGSEDNTIKIWDANNGELLNTVEGHSAVVSSVSWNHNDSAIVSGSHDKKIKIWDASNGELLCTLEGHSHMVWSVAWSHDGSKIVSGSWDKTIKIWDANSGKSLHTLEGHINLVSSVSWNRDSSKIISGSADRTINIWNGQNGELLHTLKSHSDAVDSVSWSHDESKIVSGSNDNTIKIWNAGSLELLNTLEGHSSKVTSVLWNHDDSKLVSGSNDRTIKVWDAGNGKLLNTFMGHSSPISSVSWNHDSTKIVSASHDKSLKIWSAGNGELSSPFFGHSDLVSSVSWNHDDSRVVSGSNDKTIKIWDSSNGALLNTLKGHSEVITSVSWNHDGSKIASGSNDHTMKIWQADNCELLRTLEGHSNVVSSVSWNHDSTKVASGSWDKTIKIWESGSGELLYTLEGHAVSCISWNRDSSRIVSGSLAKTISIWDACNKRLLHTLESHTYAVTSVSWNHDGSRIVSGSLDATVKIWDASNGELLDTLKGHSERVKSVSWSHDGSKIVSGSDDKTIKIWDANNFRLLNTLEGHSATVYSVSWNHDGKKIVSGSHDRSVKLWML